MLGAGAALAIGLTGTSTAAHPVASHHVLAQRPTAGATSTPPSSTPPPSTGQPAPPPASPVAAAAPAHLSTHGAATTKSHTSGESDSDLANRPPINGRPSGQSDPPGDVETPETGTKNGNTGPGDLPVSTPTALPNPGAAAPPYQP